MTVPSGARYQVGTVHFTVLNDGVFYSDAGAVFGIIPRVLWERVSGPLDERYRIPLALNCLLLRSEGKTILIETGIGGKPGDRDAASPAADGTLMDALAAAGVRPEEVDVVINSHLHSDHCGWNTVVDERAPQDAPLERRVKLGFPNATYYVGAAEWRDATHPNERTRGTYFERNLTPVADHLMLVDGELDITGEVKFVPAPGHTEGHGTVLIHSGRESAIYVGDLAQHRVQLERTVWVSSFDLLPLLSMETKKQLVDRAIEQRSLLIMTHSPYPGVLRPTRNERGFRELLDVSPLEA
ncbi:MAG: MBL fold metallo-hydrolase [Dehalococcoidia bacterium]|nr:MBL fold metallo-hydrolase [Dehalococcoidia bacterium]